MKRLRLKHRETVLISLFFLLTGITIVSLPGAGAAAVVNNSNSAICFAGLTMSPTNSPRAGTPVTISVNASSAGGQSVYYKFFYRANYGTPLYDSSPWMVVQEYSTSNSAQYTFPSDGSYIVVVRAATDPNNEPADPSIIGETVTVGNVNPVVIRNFASTATSNIITGDSVTFTASAITETGQSLYYRFYYRANYGTTAYDATSWTMVRDYATNNSCQITFPASGNYVVVARAVTDPSNEPAALPIIGTIVVIGEISGSNTHTLLAWNDLGMHCMDGADYSVFSILPPYNNLHAQLISKDATDNKLITGGGTVTYEATPYPDGSVNTSSATPTNFWYYVASLYEPLFGPIRGVDFGLKGNPTQSYTPAAMSLNNTFGWWEAEGIPTDPFDDDGAKNFYPRVKVVARDSSGNLLAATTTVLPVSDEMDCRACHASGGSDAARPAAGWVNLADSNKDYKFNILRRHDDKHAISSYLSALAQKGYVYTSSLYETSLGGTPVLCSACHSSNALPGTGVGGIDPFTTSIHGLHAGVLDPTTLQRLDDIDNRTACYRCHPGSETQCLRDPMGVAVNSNGTSQMSCQSCHGSMADVGTVGRIGWLAEPNCQSCHSNGQRLTIAQSGSQDTRFATNPDTPMAGTSLFRFSKGHGDLQCEACHGATHAIYPSTEPGDNYQSLALQGHTGTIAECGVCHSHVPDTTNGGPHGLHTVGQTWVSRHQNVAEQNSSPCAACHGTTFHGGLISKTSMSRTFQVEHGNITFVAGHSVSCYDCHNGPNGGD